MTNWIPNIFEPQDMIVGTIFYCYLFSRENFNALLDIKDKGALGLVDLSTQKPTIGTGGLFALQPRHL